jgi:hypothetical protein
MVLAPASGRLTWASPSGTRFLKASTNAWSISTRQLLYGRKGPRYQIIYAIDEHNRNL